RRTPRDWPAPPAGDTAGAPRAAPARRIRSCRPLPQVQFTVTRWLALEVVMGGQYHRPALLAVSGQVRLELGHALLVEGSEGFVEYPQRWAVQVQPGQCHAALLPGGQG